MIQVMIQTIKKGPRFTNNKAFEKIDILAIGEKTVLSKKEWSFKTPPNAFVIRRRLQREFKVETLQDNSGWQITAMS